MAVKYKLYQNTREGSEQYGMWYGRAAHDNSVNIKEISKDIEENLVGLDIRLPAAGRLSKKTSSPII